MPPQISQFFDEMERLNYDVFSSASRPFNINIVGWRNRRGRVNHFDDFIAVYFRLYNRAWTYDLYEATTRPGLPHLIAPIIPNGTAILLPGQYTKTYELGEYKGYTALKQVEPVRVYRDKNRDSAWDLDSDTIESGLFGIHIHKAGLASKLVGPFSAGCQVIKRASDFDLFIKLCNKAAANWGNKFTYTLLDF